MATTKKTNTIYQDLLEAQKQVDGVDKKGKNPFFKSDYTTLNDTIAACKQALNDNNFVVLQPITSDEFGVYVCTTLYHVTGETITSKMAIRESKSNDPQAQGSAITYARRYSLKSLLCMADSDDDGEKAMKQYRKQKADPIMDATAPRTYGSQNPAVRAQASNGRAKCELCGTVSKYHKKDCPNG